MFQYDKIIIKPELSNSEQHDIIIYKNDQGDRKMQFDVDDEIKQNIFQSSYNIYNLDAFNLRYLNFIILSFLYTTIVVKSFLLVGLGGGHLPMFIKSKINDSLIDVVELNKQVLNGAIEMGYNLNNVFIANGVDYIRQCTKKYDIVVIDLDGEESYQEFNFNEIFNVLNDGGVLAVNSYAKTGKSDLRNKIKQSFPLIKHFVNGNSNVFLCSKTIDVFETMLVPITLDMIDQNQTLSTFKYKKELINTVKLSKISLVLN